MVARTNNKPTREFEVAFDDVFSASKQGLDAWLQASQIYADGAHALVRRQTEMVNGYMTDYVATLQGLIHGQGEPTDERQVNKRLDQAKASYESGLANAQELYGIAMKANNEAMDVLSKAFLAQFDRVTGAMKAGAKGTSQAAS